MEGVMLFESLKHCMSLNAAYIQLAPVQWLDKALLKDAKL